MDNDIDWDIFRFSDIEYELSLLSQYLTVLENNIPQLINQEKERLWNDFDSNDEDDASVASHLEDRLDEGVTTRFLTGSAILAVWATYESAVHAIATDVAKRRKLTIKISHLNGNFLERSARYFKEILHLELHQDEDDLRRLRQLAELRHILAHANGRLADVSESDRKRAMIWLKQAKGIEIIEDQYLVVQISFARESFKFVEKVLQRAIANIPSE